MDWLMQFLFGLFSRDVLLVVLGSWLTILVQVFGLKGPIRKMMVEAIQQSEKKPQPNQHSKSGE